ncbi:MAG: DUF3127 domain-containing protein [SAR324 cluster bacterium]|nr:DUF3127 domain-containing protein [SAR324 cluster bacterium]
MEIQAKIIELFETVEVSDRFRKREFVVEFAENPQYPEYIKFEMVQEKCELLDHFKIGDEIEVSFNLKGRKWNSPQGEVKYFNSLQAWKLTPKNKEQDAAGKSQTNVASQPASATPNPDTSELPPVDIYEGETAEYDEDDLPF